MPSRAPWAAHFGLARTPFGKAIAAKDLFARQAHAQVTARISFCIAETLLAVITGETLSNLYGVPVEVLRTADGRLFVAGLPEAPAHHHDRHEHHG